MPAPRTRSRGVRGLAAPRGAAPRSAAPASPLPAAAGPARAVRRSCRRRPRGAPGLPAPSRAELADDGVEDLRAPVEAGDRDALVVAVEHVGEADAGALLDLHRRESVPLGAELGEV